MAKISSGTFSSDETVKSNSLTQNLIKYPEISKALIRQYPQYSFTYFTEGFGRYADEKPLGDKEFEWKVLGRTSRPMTMTGNGSGSGGSDTTFTVEFKEDFANPYDVLTFEDKTRAIVIGEPTQTGTGYMYTLKLQVNNDSATFDTSLRSAGERVGIAGSVHPEASDRGYENHVFPDTYRNWMTTSRKAKSISGDAATDILWIENNGKRLWFYEDQRICEDDFLWKLEYDRWYGKATVDSSGNVHTTDQNGDPLYAGDGVFEQIDASNVDTYTGSLTEGQISAFIRDLEFDSSTSNSTWVVFTGTAGYEQFETAMKDKHVDSGSLFFDADAGQEIPIGGEFKTYHSQGHKIVLTKNKLFDDPNLHFDKAPNGLPKESHKFVFMDFSEREAGVNNVEIITKNPQGSNLDRGFVTKYVSGMFNPFNPEEIVASNAKDAFTVEYLTQSGIVVRDPKSCGILEFA